MVMGEKKKFHMMEELNNDDESQHLNQPSYWLKEKRASPTLGFRE